MSKHGPPDVTGLQSPSALPREAIAKEGGIMETSIQHHQEGYSKAKPISQFHAMTDTPQEKSHKLAKPVDACKILRNMCSN